MIYSVGNGNNYNISEAVSLPGRYRDHQADHYNAGPDVVIKILCDLSNTVESQKEQITLLEAKVARLSKNSSNSGKRPSSDEILQSPIRRKRRGHEK